MIKMLALSLSPIVGLLLYIYQKDRYDREPSFLLFKLFLYGNLIVIPVYLVEKFLSIFNVYGSIFFQAFIVAGFTEEVFKYLVLKKIAFYDINYNEKLDGIIYSVFVSLGFAGIENIIYVFFRSNNYVYVGITRALLAVPAHMLFAITMGYYLSLMKYSKEKYTYYGYQALFIPIILHGIYDYILMSGLYQLIIVFSIFIIYLWRINLIRLNNYVNESRDSSKEK